MPKETGNGPFEVYLQFGLGNVPLRLLEFVRAAIAVPK